jgi:hypothetical protein
MKYFFLGLFVVAFTACNKNIDNPKSIVGTWELRRVFGGWSPGDSSYPPGNGHIYKFNKDKTYEFFVAGRLTNSGSYKKTTGIDPDARELMDAVILNNNFRMYYKIYADTLELHIGSVAADGVIQKYVRQ